MHQVNEDRDVCGWNHDVRRVTDGTQVCPEIVNFAVGEPGKGFVRSRILWRYLEQLIAANQRVKLNYFILTLTTCLFRIFTHHNASAKQWPKPLGRTKGSIASWSSIEKHWKWSNVFFISQNPFYTQLLIWRTLFVVSVRVPCPISGCYWLQRLKDSLSWVSKFRNVNQANLFHMSDNVNFFCTYVYHRMD